MIIPLIPIRKDAPEQEKLKEYRFYCNRLVDLFPKAFLPLGVKRRWYHFRQEHPLTEFKYPGEDPGLMIPVPPSPKNREERDRLNIPT